MGRSQKEVRAWVQEAWLVIGVWRGWEMWSVRLEKLLAYV